MSIFQLSPDFRWGAATASYQIEGAYDEDGRPFDLGYVFPYVGKGEKRGQPSKGGGRI